MTLEDPARVTLDDDEVDPGRLTTEEDSVLLNGIVIDGDRGGTDYQFSVDGTVVKAPDLGPIEADDEVSDGPVIGSVTGEKDGYRFRGNLTMLQIQGTADVLFNDR